ncbi:hypothetical protein [Sulfuritortus calidifontis]|uniref:hypothetical protein n=1 Tax=Sulfuritortus calidifontis TaxID=1914471 RepID=UPI000F842BEE|nr:hypothetical protein [Sulfuritortus calidifontis]
MDIDTLRRALGRSIQKLMSLQEAAAELDAIADAAEELIGKRVPSIPAKPLLDVDRHFLDRFQESWMRFAYTLLHESDTCIRQALAAIGDDHALTAAALQLRARAQQLREIQAAPHQTTAQAQAHPAPPIVLAPMEWGPRILQHSLGVVYLAHVEQHGLF